MPDFIERTIYKMELDDSDYIRGVDRMASNTARLSQQQVESNRRLQETQNILRTSQTALDNITNKLTRYRVELQNATGRNTGIQKQYEQEIPKLEAEHAKLTQTVIQNKKAYEEAAQAAIRFNSAAAQPTTGITPQRFGFGAGPTATPTAFPALPNVNPQLLQLLEQLRSIQPDQIANVFDIAAGEMDAFKLAIEQAEIALDEMTHTEKEFNEEFKNLSLVVSEGKKIIEEFDKSTAEAARSSLGYRQQITLLHKELAVLEQAGKKETAEYVAKQKELIKLRRAYNDQQQAVRILASETRALDFGRSAITTATSAFQAYTSVAILAGGASEDLQKKTFQLFAAMQLITSLEQLNNQLKAVSVIRTNAQSVAQAAFTAVVGASTGALRAFRIALAATGVGAIVVGLGFLITKIMELREAAKEAREEQEFFNDINKEAAGIFTQQVVHLNLIREQLTNGNNAIEQRIKLAKQYNETAEEGNKIDLKQIENIDAINAAIDRQIARIKARAIARAAENALVKEADKVFLESERARERAIASVERERQGLTGQRPEDFRPETQLVADPVTGQIVTRIVTEEERIAQKIANDPKLKAANERFEEILKRVAPLIKIDDLITVEPDKGGTTSKVENVFEQERQRLLDRLALLRVEQEKGIKRINDEFALKLIAEQRRIAALLKDNKITGAQAKILIDLAATINKTELDKALDDFNKAVIDKREKLNEDLRDLQLKNLTDTIGLIQNEFNRRAALIDLNEQKEIEAIRNVVKERLEALQQLGEQTGTTGFEQFQIEKNNIVQAGQDAETNIVRRAAQERQQLAFDSFKQTLQFFDQAITDGKLIGDKAALAEIQELTKTFQSGAIKYEEYKKRLAAIQKKYEDAQLQLTIDTLQAEIRALQARAQFTFNLTEDQYNELIKLIKQKEAELVAAQTRQTVATGEAGKPATPPQVETIADYANAIGQLTESIISFWAEANKAEQEALDRSITIQERRVEEARRIAERGNATYLKMEEDRLKQLQIARENAARRELGINAAIQASQLMVGITGAISKIATPGIGIAETIAAVAVIVSSLAAGFALVRTLQNNQPRFSKGETYVKRKAKEPAGVDTVQAWLTEGEAVISKDKNKEYHPVITAIHDGTVPASYLNKQIERYHDYKHEVNNFTRSVEKYHTVKSVPVVNYERVKQTAELHINADGKLAALISDQNKKIDENNNLQRQTLEAMKHMSVDARIDKDGVAIAVNEYMKQLKINQSI